MKMKRNRFEKIVEKRQKTLRLERKVTVMRKWIDWIQNEFYSNKRKGRKLDLMSTMEGMNDLIVSVNNLPLDEQEVIKGHFNLVNHDINLFEQFEQLFVKLTEWSEMSEEELDEELGKESPHTRNLFDEELILS